LLYHPLALQTQTFHIQNGLKQANALSPLLFNLEDAIRKVQEDWLALKLNGTHQLLPVLMM
jgi:hypothetical protein